MTSLADSGTGSLRAAIQKANSDPAGDVIEIQVTGTAKLASGTLNLTGDYTITNDGVHSLTVDGDGNTAFYVAPGANITMIGANGSGQTLLYVDDNGYGPGIQVGVFSFGPPSGPSETLTTSGVSVLGSYAQGNYADGMDVYAGGTVVLNGGNSFINEYIGMEVFGGQVLDTPNLGRPLDAFVECYEGAWISNGMNSTPLTDNLQNALFLYDYEGLGLTTVNVLVNNCQFDEDSSNAITAMESGCNMVLSNSAINNSGNAGLGAVNLYMPGGTCTISATLIQPNSGSPAIITTAGTLYFEDQSEYIEVFGTIVNQGNSTKIVGNPH